MEKDTLLVVVHLCWCALPPNPPNPQSSLMYLSTETVLFCRAVAHDSRRLRFSCYFLPSKCVARHCDRVFHGCVRTVRLANFSARACGNKMNRNHHHHHTAEPEPVPVATAAGFLVHFFLSSFSEQYACLALLRFRFVGWGGKG